MATEKRPSKGRFLYFFDWNTKSRKKLFSNNIETSEGSTQGKDSVDNLVVPHYLLDIHENRDHHSFRGSSSYSCALSVNGDDGYGTRAPGVVARLMGLDTMPTIASCEASSLSSYDPCAVSNSSYPKGAASFPLEDHILKCSYIPNKVDGTHWNSIDSRTKIHGQLIERFQTEVLPPKSAKPISITHHKLLSPIKSPGFIPTKDAAYIMEAAARILDPSSQPTSRVKIPSLGSPSSSFKFHNLKDKIDAAQRASRLPESSKTQKLSSPMKQVRANSSDQSSHRSLFKNILSSEASSSQKVKAKGKPASVPGQDKVNMHKKEGSVYGENMSQLQKEHKRAKLRQKQANTHKNGQTKTSRNRSSGVLKQNNEKQNSINFKENATSKTPVFDQKHGKVVLGDSSAGPSKIIKKVYVNSENASKKVITETNVSDKRTPSNGVIDKRPSLNRMKKISKNKQFRVRENQLSENIPGNSDRRDVQSDASLQGDSRKDMEVISFTFTSPIKKTCSQSLSSIEAIRSNHHVGADSCDLAGQSHTRSSSTPPLGLNLIDSGSLSLLLEQKLIELTNKVGAAKFESEKERHDTDSVSCLSESMSLHDTPSFDWMDYDECSDKDEIIATCDDGGSLPSVAKSSQKLEESNLEHCISITDTNRFEARRSDVAHLNILAPECSVSGSCLSSNTTSNVTHAGYDQPSSTESQEVTSCISTESFHTKEDETEYSDLTSYWEQDYVRHVIHYAGLKGSRLGKDSNVIDPCVFDVLESLINTSGRNAELCTKPERRNLFECVADVVSSRHERVFVGSRKAWAKWAMLLENEWVTEEVYREILYLQSMGNLMVDELVDMDMSTQYGKWLDFEIESLEEGIEIENKILASLVDEMVEDFCIL